jgi:hypothetical protein
VAGQSAKHPGGADGGVAQLKLHARVTVPEVPGEPGQVHQAEVGQHAHPEGAPQAPAQPLDRVARRQRRVQDGLRLRQQRLPGLGQLDPPRVALKQDHVQVLLEGGDRGRHGALDHVEPLRGAGEATLSRDNHESPNALQI